MAPAVRLPVSLEEVGRQVRQPNHQGELPQDSEPSLGTIGLALPPTHQDKQIHRDPMVFPRKGGGPPPG